MISAAALVFAVNVFSSVLKRWVKPAFGVVGVHVTVFILALIGALYVTYQGVFPDIATWVGTALAVFTLAVAFYEVILSHIPIFKGK